MVRMKMDYYINLALRPGSRHYTKSNAVQSCGIRHSTFYVDGNPSKVVSQSDIEGVFMMKDGVYQKVELDTFLALYRQTTKSA